MAIIIRKILQNITGDERKHRERTIWCPFKDRKLPDEIALKKHLHDKHGIVPANRYNPKLGGKWKKKNRKTVIL